LRCFKSRLLLRYITYQSTENISSCSDTVCKQIKKNPSNVLVTWLIYLQSSHLYRFLLKARVVIVLSAGCNFYTSITCSPKVWLIFPKCLYSIVIIIIIIIQLLTLASSHFWFVFYSFVQLCIVCLRISSCVMTGLLLLSLHESEIN